MDLRARLGQVKEYFIMFKICFDISSVPAPLAIPLCQQLLRHIPLHRSDLHKDVIKGSEILEVLHQTPEVITITQTMDYKLLSRCGTTCSPCTIASIATSSQRLGSWNRY